MRRILRDAHLHKTWNDVVVTGPGSVLAHAMVYRNQARARSPFDVVLEGSPEAWRVVAIVPRDQVEDQADALLRVIVRNRPRRPPGAAP